MGVFVAFEVNFSDSNSSGSVLIEFAITALLLFIFVAGLVNFGVGFDSYFRLVQASRDGSYLGAKLEGIGPGPCTSTISFDLDNLNNPSTLTTPSCLDSAHLFMHDRVNTLLSLLPRRFISVTQTSTYTPIDNTVELSLRVNFKPLIPFLPFVDGFPFTVTTTAYQKSTGLTLSIGDRIFLERLFGISGSDVSGNEFSLSNGVFVNLSKSITEGY